MKQNPLNSWRRGLRTIGLATAGVTLFSCSALAQDPKPEQDQPQSKKLERKAEDLQADPRAVEAGKVRRDPDEVQAEADRLDKDQPAKGKAKDKRWIEAKRELRKAQEALQDLREGGKEAEAAEVERRVKKLEAKLERLERAPEGDRGDEPEWGGPRPPGEGPPEMAEMERRLRHLKVAVENLHAAGMHDVADKLTREGERMRRELGEDARAGLRGPMPPGPELERLHAEMQELRQIVQDLQERVEALSRKER